jgi:hypothetical protein
VKGHDLAEVGEDLADREDHVRGARVLHDLPVDPRLQVQPAAGIADLVVRDDRRERAAGIGVLAQGPEPGVHLVLAGRQVVEGGVAEDAGQRRVRVDPRQRAAHHSGQFDLPVQPRLAVRYGNRRAVGDQRHRPAPEEGRVLGGR